MKVCIICLAGNKNGTSDYDIDFYHMIPYCIATNKLKCDNSWNTLAVYMKVITVTFKKINKLIFRTVLTSFYGNKTHRIIHMECQKYWNKAWATFVV